MTPQPTTTHLEQLFHHYGCANLSGGRRLARDGTRAGTMQNNGGGRNERRQWPNQEDKGWFAGDGTLVEDVTLNEILLWCM